MSEEKPHSQLLGNPQQLMKIEVGKTYKNYYGAKIEIFEAPIEGKCHWFKGNVNDGKSTWKLFPSYFHEDGSRVQFPNGNPAFNLVEEI